MTRRKRFDKKGVWPIIAFFQLKIERRIDELRAEIKKMNGLLAAARNFPSWKINKKIDVWRAEKYKEKIMEKIVNLKSLVIDFEELESKITADDMEVIAEEFLAEFTSIIGRKQIVKSKLNLSSRYNSKYFAKKLAQKK